VLSQSSIVRGRVVVVVVADGGHVDAVVVMGGCGRGM